MNEALRELYQETIMGHNRSPRNFHGMDDADGQATGHNPLCGDKLVVFLRHGDGGEVEDVSFVGEGCAISRASASMMTEAVKGLGADDAEALYHAFHRLVTRAAGQTDDDGSDGDPSADEALLGKLRVFAGVGAFPARVKCATLPWRTMQTALRGDAQTITTE